MSATCPHCGHELDRRQLAGLLLTLRSDDHASSPPGRVRDHATGLLDRVRDHTAANPPATRETLRNALPDNVEAIDAALAALIAVGALTRWRDGYRIAKRPGTAGVAEHPTSREATASKTPRGGAA
jgi:hypothetical protein